jgi:tetratricopeptide (TPR) repeat protein
VSLSRAAPLVALVLLACAHGPETHGARPSGASDGALAGHNDEELFVMGSAAAQAGDDARAAAAFGRLADAFPASPRAAAALRGAGLAERRLGRLEAALARFEALGARGEGEASDEGRFLAAECLWRLGRRGDARASLEGLVARRDLGPAAHLRAVTERAVLDLEDGAADQARGALREAIAAFERAGDQERLDSRDTAQARFYLGEAERARFLAAPLDPGRGDAEALRAELEAKAQLLLAAQEAYLGAMRTGHPAYAVAAGERVGELYVALRQQLLAAPLPPGLDEASTPAYRADLRDEVKVLAAKAVVAYEETLSAARRAGVENEFVPRAEQALARMREELELTAP